MNKIDIGNEIIYLDNNTYYLQIDNSKEINLVAKRNTSSKLLMIGLSNYHVNLLLEENSEVIVNSLNKNNSVSVNIELKRNSNVTYNHSVCANMDSDNTFTIIHQDNDSNSVINNNGINLGDNKLFFRIDGVIPKELKNINCSQNSKIINFNDGNSKIIPNLIIDSNDIVANHSAYIGEMNEDEVFYLMSRGINLKDIEMMYYKSVMLGKMQLFEEREIVNQIINEWW